MRTELNKRVAMRDGSELSVDIYLPEQSSQCPALVAMSPYGKEMQTMPIGPQPVTSSVHRRSVEAGDSSYLTDQGYIHVIADVRGIGKSDGEYLGWMNRDEATDGYDLIEWVAEQSWCSGRVGMVGVSYYGTIQLHIAAAKPPSLVAIMPWNAPADFYRESTHHGGIRQSFFHTIYGIGIRGRSAVATKEELSDEEFSEKIVELSTDLDLCMYPDLYNLVHNPDRIPGYFDILAHPYDGEFYWERSANKKYDQISIPCYFNSYWWAYAHMHLRGAFEHYRSLNVPKKLRIGSRLSGEAPLPRSYNEEVVRWYDHWLKGESTGVMEESPISIFVRGENQFRAENEWPLERTKWCHLYLRRWEELGWFQEEVPDKPDCFVQQPPDETTSIASVRYDTRPFPEDLEITGPVSMTLFASIDSDDTNWIVSIEDVGNTGNGVEITRGFLKASHREVDEDRSQPWMPYHPHLQAETVPIDEVVEYRIELSPMANIFRAGHRLRLVVAAADNPFNPGDDMELGFAHRPWHIVRSETVLHRIFHDETRPSHLLLPVIQRN